MCFYQTVFRCECKHVQPLPVLQILQQAIFCKCVLVSNISYGIGSIHSLYTVLGISKLACLVYSLFIQFVPNAQHHIFAQHLDLSLCVACTCVNPLIQH